LTSVDHRDHEALVAVDPGANEIIGSARYVRVPDRPGDAELAVEVIDAWRRRASVAVSSRRSPRSPSPMA
jgi:hypothetical protein